MRQLFLLIALLFPCVGIATPIGDFWVEQRQPGGPIDFYGVWTIDDGNPNTFDVLFFCDVFWSDSEGQMTDAFTEQFYWSGSRNSTDPIFTANYDPDWQPGTLTFGPGEYSLLWDFKLLHFTELSEECKKNGWYSNGCPDSNDYTISRIVHEVGFTVQVPEPSALALFALGLAGVWHRRHCHPFKCRHQILRLATKLKTINSRMRITQKTLLRT